MEELVESTILETIVEFPQFDEKINGYWLIICTDQFWNAIVTPEAQRLKEVEKGLSGGSLRWFHLWKRKNPDAILSTFQLAFLHRYSDFSDVLPKADHIEVSDEELECEDITEEEEDEIADLSNSNHTNLEVTKVVLLVMHEEDYHEKEENSGGWRRNLVAVVRKELDTHGNAIDDERGKEVSLSPPLVLLDLEVAVTMEQYWTYYVSSFLKRLKCQSDTSRGCSSDDIMLVLMFWDPGGNFYSTTIFYSSSFMIWGPGGILHQHYGFYFYASP